MKRIYLIVGPSGFVLLWFIITLFPLVSPILLPPPHRIAKAGYDLFVSLRIFPDLFYTICLWLAGLFLGIFIGVPLGILMGYFEKVHKSLELLIDFFRSLPSIVLYPVFVIIFGLGVFSKIAVVVFASALYIIINTIYGVKYSRESRFMLAKLLRATKLQTFTKIVIPSALADIFAGIRTSLSIGLIVTVGSEMIMGGNLGLGKRVLDASMVYNMSEMYALIIVVGLLGYGSNKIFVLIEDRVIHWRGK